MELGPFLVAHTIRSLPAVQETRVQSLGREDSPGEGNGNPLQYPCLENSMEEGAWQSTVRHNWRDLAMHLPLGHPSHLPPYPIPLCLSSPKSQSKFPFVTFTYGNVSFPATLPYSPPTPSPCSVHLMVYGLLVPWPGIEPRPPALGAWSLSRWTREVPPLAFF